MATSSIQIEDVVGGIAWAAIMVAGHLFYRTPSWTIVVVVVQILLTIGICVVAKWSKKKRGAVSGDKFRTKYAVLLGMFFAATNTLLAALGLTVMKLSHGSSPWLLVLVLGGSAGFCALVYVVFLLNRLDNRTERLENTLKKIQSDGEKIQSDGERETDSTRE